MKYWEIIADRLKNRGYHLGWSKAITPDGPLWIVDAHRNNGPRHVVRADELLTAFLELELTVR